MICRSCDSTNLSSILDLGVQPWCNDFISEDKVGKENIYPLNLMHCDDCGLLQLSHTVAKETMFADRQCTEYRVCKTCFRGIKKKRNQNNNRIF